MERAEIFARFAPARLGDLATIQDRGCGVHESVVAGDRVLVETPLQNHART